MDSNVQDLDPVEKFRNKAGGWTKVAFGKFSESVLQKRECVDIGDEKSKAAAKKKIEKEKDFLRYAEGKVGAEDGGEFFGRELKKYIEHGDREFYFQQLKFHKIYVMFKNAREEKTRLENIIMHLDRFLSHGSRFIKKNQNQRETIEEPDSNFFGGASSQDFLKKELIKTTQNFRYSTIGNKKDRVEYSAVKLFEGTVPYNANRKISFDDCSVGKFGQTSVRNQKIDSSTRDVFSLFDAKNRSNGFSAKYETSAKERHPMSVKNNTMCVKNNSW